MEENAFGPWMLVERRARRRKEYRDVGDVGGRSLEATGSRFASLGDSNLECNPANQAIIIDFSLAIFSEGLKLVLNSADGGGTDLNVLRVKVNLGGEKGKVKGRVLVWEVGLI